MLCQGLEFMTKKTDGYKLTYLAIIAELTNANPVNQNIDTSTV